MNSLLVSVTLITILRGKIYTKIIVLLIGVGECDKLCEIECIKNTTKNLFKIHIIVNPLYC